MDGLNWSGYDGLTTGALTLSTAAVDINSQGGNIQFASIAGGSQDLSLNAGVAAGTTTVTGNVTALGDGTGAALTVDNSATGLVDFRELLPETVVWWPERRPAYSLPEM